ncbi:membrane-binding protein [Brevundimonas sp. AJA228-03]|uniref:hypothetical protein n=1 Tax=Brevundimonas sp. AJA228-03 TaxID=2752515 RepID=UPI001ADF66D3|nr:hypothetical protein [Brevundimonas sp. AJA228-03]QTN19727.1 membrane-binding protein [Brevundimonas sp. AJA228-03]
MIVRVAFGTVLSLGLAAASPQELITFDGSCVYDGDVLDTEGVYGFESDADAEAATKRIMDQTGLVQNFTIRAADVPNAAAVINGESRMILYNQQFMRDVRRTTNTDWAAVSIMAHEVGHHLQGHTIRAGGSRPASELEADRYSGFVLHKMGATLEQAQAAMNALGSEAGSPTHPRKSARLAAITNGWQAAEDIRRNGTTPASQTPTNASTQSQVPTPPVSGGSGMPVPGTVTSPPPIQYVSRVVFPQDPVVYMVTNAGDIVALTPTGPALVGKRAPPTMPGFAWMYQTAFVTYGVTFAGEVIGQYPNGVFYPVGFVTAPS